MEDTLSQQLSRLFNDIDKIQSLGHKLSLKMFIEDATDLMMLIQDIKVPDLEFVFEDFNSIIINKEEMPSA